MWVIQFHRVSPSAAASGSLLFFLVTFQFLPGTLKDQEVVDHETSQLKTLMEYGIRGQEMPQQLIQRCPWSPFWRASRLSTVFLSYQSIRISGVSAFRLEKFYGNYRCPQKHCHWIRTQRQQSQCKNSQENSSQKDESRVTIHIYT